MELGTYVRKTFAPGLTLLTLRMLLADVVKTQT